MTPGCALVSGRRRESLPGRMKDFFAADYADHADVANLLITEMRASDSTPRTVANLPSPMSTGAGVFYSLWRGGGLSMRQR
jgi:hypothetical protein